MEASEGGGRGSSCSEAARRLRQMPFTKVSSIGLHHSHKGYHFCSKFASCQVADCRNCWRQTHVTRGLRGMVHLQRRGAVARHWIASESEHIVTSYRLHLSHLRHVLKFIIVKFRWNIFCQYVDWNNRVAKAKNPQQAARWCQLSSVSHTGVTAVGLLSWRAKSRPKVSLNYRHLFG